MQVAASIAINCTRVAVGLQLETGLPEGKTMDAKDGFVARF